MPDPATGELKIDPEIVLKAKAFNLQTEFYYLAGSSTNGVFGNRRSASVNAFVDVGSNAVRVFRGDESSAAYSKSQTIGGVSFYTGAGFNAHSTAYAYDAVDNLTVSGETGMFSLASYDLAGRMVTATYVGGVTTYGYDANGNLTKVQEPTETYTMAYDPENRLLSHLRPDGLVATYLYDPDGKKRVEAEYNGISTLVWDGTSTCRAAITTVRRSSRSRSPRRWRTGRVFRRA